MPRFIHEASLRFEGDIEKKTQSSQIKALIQGAAKPVPAFNRPYDVVARYGRIYVSDPDASAISVYDIPRRRFYRLGLRLEGRLVKPMGIALDQQSNLYVADM